MRTRRFPGFFVCVLAVLAAIAVADDASSDSPGVKVSLNGSALLHRARVQYPKAALDKAIQGIVIVEAMTDSTGNVGDARVLSGPDELRRAALESVLQWHFRQDAANSTRPVQIEFTLPRPVRAPAPDFFPSLIVLQRFPAGPIDRPVRHIEILGYPSEVRNQLAARLPVHEGDVLTQELADATGQVVRDFDEHLNLGFQRDMNGDALLQILAPGYSGPTPAVFTPR